MANETKNKGWGFGLPRSPVYKALRVLPTPVRPWLMAYDMLGGLYLSYVEAKHGMKEASLGRKQQSLAKQLAKAQARRGGGLKAVALAAGVGYLASWLLPRATEGPRLRVTGFMDEALGGVAERLDQVQATVNDGFVRARQRVGAGGVASPDDQA